MTDSIKQVDDNLLRRLHAQYAGGKLYKGQTTTAATASIPTRYQTVVTSNVDKKGFGMRSKRFNYELGADDKPSPATYVGHSHFEQSKPSFGKKGTGGFASKSRRSSKTQLNHCPGAGKYALPSLLQSRQDFNKANATGSFAAPIAKNLERPGQPAPNAYQPDKAKPIVGKQNNVVANAAFKSASKRDFMNMKDALSKPTPWHYTPSDLPTKAETRAPISSFKSKSKRQDWKTTDNPGPGTYKPWEEIEPALRTVFPRKHYLCISAPAMPLPAPIPNPGPGAYELRDYEGPVKHYMSSSAFVSSTSRWTGNVDGDAQVKPGPAHYHPGQTGKESFIYNMAGRWL